jgi:hypothetical protein
MDDRDIEEIEKSYILEFSKFWRENAADFVISNSTNEPHKMFDLEFTLYNFCIVRITLEHNSVWVGDVSKGVFLKLLPKSISSNDVVKHLPQIDREVKLRIPDKYLEAKD